MTFSHSFQLAIAFTLGWEGMHLETVKNDPGGTTFCGIDQRDHPSVDVAALTVEDAKRIYFDNEWQWCKGDDLPEEWATLLFDATVNPGRASLRWVQQIIGVQADGVIGPHTILELRTTGHRERSLFCDRCETYYRSVANEHPMMSRFLQGWLNRNDARRALG